MQNRIEEYDFGKPEMFDILLGIDVDSLPEHFSFASQ